MSVAEIKVLEPDSTISQFRSRYEHGTQALQEALKTLPDLPTAVVHLGAYEGKAVQGFITGKDLPVTSGDEDACVFLVSGPFIDEQYETDHPDEDISYELFQEIREVVKSRNTLWTNHYTGELWRHHNYIAILVVGTPDEAFQERLSSLQGYKLADDNPLFPGWWCLNIHN